MSEKVTAMIEEIKGLTVLELSELVHALEEEFGVSAAAMADRRSGSGRGQGFRRVRSEGSEGGRVQGGCRKLQEAARRGWREGRDQVIILADCVLKMPVSQDTGIFYQGTVQDGALRAIPLDFFLHRD